MPTSVTIKGTGFKGLGFELGPSSVHIGPTNGPTNVTDLVVVNETTITCTLPPKDPTWDEHVRLWITTPMGVGSRPAAFHYIPPEPLRVDTLEPATGHYSGGTTVVITGTKLTNTARLEFDLYGDISVFPSFVVDSDTQITAVTPSGTRYAPYGLRVILDPTPEFPTGEVFEYKCFNGADPAWMYSGDPEISVTALLPSTELGTLGGFTCTIKGTGFVSIGLTDVSFQGLSSIVFTVVDDETATFTCPDAPTVNSSAYMEIGGEPPGVGEIWFYQNLGSPITNIAIRWLPLKINEVSPSVATQSGGDVITLIGTSMDTLTSVIVHDDQNVLSYDVSASIVIIDNTRATFVFPEFTTPSTDSAARIQIMGILDAYVGAVEGDGDPLWTAYESYWRYDIELVPGRIPPAPIAIVPNTGPVAGGTHVVVEVVDSTDLLSVLIGGVVQDNFAIDDATHVSCDTVAVAGPTPSGVSVNVTNAYGTSVPLVNAFVFT